MYSQEDKKNIENRIRKYAVLTAVEFAVLLAVFCVLIGIRQQALAMLALSALWCVTCFMFLQYIMPCIRYSHYLKDITLGKSRVIEGVLGTMDEKEQEQDGVRVYALSVIPKDDPEGRVLYIDVDKTDCLPEQGKTVRFTCFGRHICAAEVI